jgi:pyridoxal phosphate enzyme (YggS family)
VGQIVTAIADNLAIVRRRIESACARANRRSEQIELIAVSKLQASAAIRDCHAAGQRDFGENYAQELRDKAVELASLADLRWHAIGPLQINKAKYVARFAHAFHALDRLDVAQELSRRRSAEPLRCFIEVNLASEDSKRGLDAVEIGTFFDSIQSLRGLQIVGLMCLPPLARDPEDSRPYFRRLKELAKRLRLEELSMGTTADFEVAIEEGSTAVRVGTAIFGERPGK